MNKNYIFVIVMALCLVLSGCGGNKESAESTDDKKQTTTEEAKKEEAVEPNTSEMVDNIIKKAKEDAKTATLEQRQEALEFVKNNIDDCTKDNETMENMMHYGALLEYAYNDDENPEIKNTIISGVGMDAVQAVKYLYRGYSEDEETASKENISQVKEGLEKIEELREIGKLIE